MADQAKFVEKHIEDMIGLASAAVGLAGSIFGGVKAAKARKTQDRILREARTRNDNMFNKEYYQDYMERSDARAAMKRVRDTMRKSNRSLMSNAAITGATPEAMAAQRAVNNETLTNTASAIQANADAYKSNVRDQYMSQQNALDSARIEQAGRDEQGYAQMANNSLEMMAKGLGGSNVLGK